MPNTLVPAAFAAYSSALTAPSGCSTGAATPALPILYFGDHDAFQTSKLHIITVGVNPSHMEFPQSNPWLRFPGWQTHFNPLVPTAPLPANVYLGGLNNYFSSATEYKWFDSMRDLLGGFNASYYSTHDQYTALHTDLLSPVATNPVWSKLSRTATHYLAGSGLPLWIDLVNKLRPHIALVSLRQSHQTHLNAISNSQPWMPVATIQKPWGKGTRVITIEHKVAVLSGGHKMDIVFVRKLFQEPFSGLNSQQKAGIGPMLRGKLANW